jgi:hypothetical protein
MTIDAVILEVADPVSAARFYADAFGCRWPVEAQLTTIG